ncbi:SRPBCC family protein [Streptosporangium sandarakinum]|uniref:SRPBCC family protein n=1 Tax=Streptosporangium sandarakinum TaxID=1260955 RepID=UPI0034485E5F
MEDHDVTGSRVEIETTVGLPPERLWDLITDVPRIADWSPECEHLAWLDADDAAPRVGARFEGRNRRQDRVWTVTSVVTEADRPRSFAWVVLDRAGDPERPSSRWRYDLEPAEEPGRTVVRHSFEHGPGDSGLREMIRSNPEIASVILDVRLGELRKHMTETLDAMTRG